MGGGGGGGGGGEGHWVIYLCSSSDTDDCVHFLWVQFGGFSEIPPYFNPPLFLPAIIKSTESTFGFLAGYINQEACI